MQVCIACHIDEPLGFIFDRAAPLDDTADCMPMFVLVRECELTIARVGVCDR
jgi:hypothetical protein